MLNLNRRVPAFSLAEMLVVMLLSGLATGIIYFAYYTVNQYHVNLGKKYEEVSDANSLCYLVNRDFDQCDYVKLSSGMMICSDEDTLFSSRYSFLPTAIVRKQGERSDTFRVTPLAFSFRFNGKRTLDQMIDVFYLDAACLSDTLHMKFVKNYDASSLIRQFKKDTIW